MIPLRPFVEFGVVLAGLCAVFASVLLDLWRLSGSEELYSHLPLIPLIAGYLVWINRQSLAGGASLLTDDRRPTTDGEDVTHARSHRGFKDSRLDPIVPGGARLSERADPSVLIGTRSWIPATIAMILGIGVVIGYMVAVGGGWKPAVNDRLAVLMFGFLCCVWAAVFATLGLGFVRAMLFPLGFLVFIVPFPTFAIDGINWFFQHLSAEAAYVMLKIPGTPIFRTGLVMQMPGITIEVAEECSGIRSTLVLFITSLMGGYMFLKNPWHRFWFVTAIVPLAILRNGFRIFTISMLAVHIDPSMINSWIHRKGGPVFFALSLVPLFLLLAWFRRREAARLTTD